MRKQNRFGKALMVIAFGGAAITSTPAAPLPCPGGAIKMVIPNPAGGIGDLIGRIISEKAGAGLGQPIIIENSAGATTTIGTNLVVRSKADGCTILSLTASGVVVSVLRDKLPYDLEKDLKPIMGIGSLPMVLAIPSASKLSTFSDLVSAAKSKDGITYGSGGVGSLAHLSAARLINELGGTGNHVPYRGNADATQALLGNHIQLFFPSTAEALPLAKSGKIKILGVTWPERLPTMPDVPTMKELGFAEFNPKLWFALMAPSGTPEETLARQRDAFSKALADASVQERLKTLGFTPEVQSASAVSQLMSAEAARWGKVIKTNGIKSAD